jgi:hypothetical protein
MNQYSEKEILAAKKLVVSGQVNRFHISFKKFFDREDTKALVEFFFEKVYNTEAKAEWVDLAISSFDKVKNIVKDETRESMEKLLDLNSLTDKLDREMAIHLLNKNHDLSKNLSVDEFISEFVEFGHGEDRYKQFEIVLLNLVLFYELAHRPINAILIKPAKFMSKVLGFQSLFSAVEEGYNACLPVSRDLFNDFYNEVENTEYQFLGNSFPHLKEKYEQTRINKKTKKN